jgi:hypothetical protein
MHPPSPRSLRGGVRASTAMLGGQGAGDIGNACALRSPVIGSPRSK